MALSLDNTKLLNVHPPAPVSRSVHMHAPPTALKVKPRIPTRLQAVFLEAGRTGIAHSPPAYGLANKTFVRRNSRRKEKRSDKEQKEQQSPTQKLGRHKVLCVTLVPETFRCGNSIPTQLSKCRWKSPETSNTLDMPKHPRRL